MRENRSVYIRSVYVGTISYDRYTFNVLGRGFNGMKLLDRNSRFDDDVTFCGICSLQSGPNVGLHEARKKPHHDDRFVVCNHTLEPTIR